MQIQPLILAVDDEVRYVVATSFTSALPEKGARPPRPCVPSCTSTVTPGR